TWASATAAAQMENYGKLSTTTKAEREPNWIRLSDPQPRAWLVTRAIPSPNPSVDIVRIDLAGEPLIDAPLLPPQFSPSLKGSVEIQTDRPGNFAATTDCPSTQLLIVTESFHSGWKAAIDGQVADVLRTDGDFLGLLVPAQHHQIRLTFQPESLHYG